MTGQGNKTYPAADFLDIAARCPSRTGILSETVEVTYQQIAHVATCMAAHLIEAGLQKDRTLGVRSDDLLFVLSSILATGLIGARWVYATDRVVDDPRIGIDLLLQADANEAVEDAVQVDESWLRPTARLSAGTLKLDGPDSQDHTWMISSTSGTTGTPKFVALSHRIVAARSVANRQWFDEPGRMISCLFPIGAPALLSRYLSALLNEGTIVESARPEFWCRHDVDLIVGSPSQVRDALNDVVLPHKLDLLHLSGGTAPDSQVRHLLQSFRTVANGYGSTEAHNTLSNIRTLGEDGEIKTRTELRGVDLEIVDEGDMPQPAGTEGIVRIRNNYLAPGYIQSPEAQAACFRNGWFYPGDLGMWTKSGVFMVTGRINDQFNIGGVKLNAAVLDYTIQSVDGVKDAITFLMPRENEDSRLTAFISIVPGHDPTEVLTNARLATLRFGGNAAVPEKFLFAEELPRNLNGKPDRKACVEIILQRRASRENKNRN